MYPPKKKFLWWPGKVYDFDGQYIQFIRWGWLEYVSLIDTIWHGPMYFELPNA